MSLGLLGAYGGSDSEENDSSDQESDVVSDKQALKETVTKEEDKDNCDRLENPFVSSSNNSSLGGGTILPKPSFMQKTERIEGLKFNNDTSVFSNPFREKEEKKKAILEQHVSMTQKQEELRTINGKKVCWMYRKGRCWQGHKCPYAHDNDVKTEINDKDGDDGEGGKTEDKMGGPAKVIQLGQPDRDHNTNNKEETAPNSHKRRPGLSQHLVPSKKAMKFHNQVYNNK